MNMRNMIDLMLESSGSSTGKVSLKLTKSGKPKKISDRKGKPTPNGDWLKKMKLEHDAEMKAFHEASESKRGTAMTFASNYRKEHEDEYAAFVASWKESHSDSGSETATTLEAEETESIATPDMPLSAPLATPLATVAAATPVVPVKKAVKKAQKAQPYTPTAVPIQVNVTEEFLPFTMGTVTYLRKGCPRPDGNHLWTSGHLWMCKKGVKGAYYGEIQENGTIDTEVDEPSA